MKPFSISIIHSMGTETGQITFQGVLFTTSSYFVRQWAHFTDREVESSDDMTDYAILIGA